MRKQDERKQQFKKGMDQEEYAAGGATIPDRGEKA